MHEEKLSDHEKQHIPKSRLEAFSDGVFAIVVTLLVLEFHLPALPAHATTEQYLTGLLPLGLTFLSFALSFLVIAIFWVNHHTFFHFLHDVDGSLLWYNNLLLFWLCFIPFPTAFLGAHPLDTVPVMLYGANMFLAAFAFFLLSRHAVNHGFMRVHLSPTDLKYLKVRRTLGTVMYGLSIPLALVSVYLSLAIFVLVPVLYFFPRMFADVSV